MLEEVFSTRAGNITAVFVSVDTPTFPERTLNRQDIPCDFSSLRVDKLQFLKLGRMLKTGRHSWGKRTPAIWDVGPSAVPRSVALAR